MISHYRIKSKDFAGWSFASSPYHSLLFFQPRHTASFLFFKDTVSQGLHTSNPQASHGLLPHLITPKDLPYQTTICSTQWQSFYPLDICLLFVCNIQKRSIFDNLVYTDLFLKYYLHTLSSSVIYPVPGILLGKQQIFNKYLLNK